MTFHAKHVPLFPVVCVGCQDTPHCLLCQITVNGVHRGEHEPLKTGRRKGGRGGEGKGDEGEGGKSEGRRRREVEGRKRGGGGEEGEGWRQRMKGDEQRKRESGKMEVRERKRGRDGDG